MNDIQDEKLVERFLMQGRIDVPDRGFSRRVMRRLPDRTARLTRWWTALCAVVGVVVVATSDVFSWGSGMLHGLLADVSTHEPLLGSPVLTAFCGMVVLSLLSATVVLKDLR